MKQIHYFQRFSTKENVITNNTLLLFSRLYHFSVTKLKNLLNGLSDEELEIGLNIFQQTKAIDSIPDGFIEQKSLKIVIETKRSSHFDLKQLENHLKAFGNEEQQFLVCLGTDLPDSKFQIKIQNIVTEYNKINNQNIKLVFTSFKSIVTNFNQIINEYDVELKELIDDYEGFCQLENLISKDDLILRMPLSGQSFEVNLKSGLYFDPAERGYRLHSFIGLYKEKAIRAIGKLENIVTADLVNDILEIKDSIHNVTNEQKLKIINAITFAKEINGWNISIGHKFYIVEKFIQIEFIKETPRAPFGTRYFNLNEYIPNLNKENSVEYIANELNKICWQ